MSEQHQILCKKCNIVKDVKDIVKKEGKYRNLCKDCRNKEARDKIATDEDLRNKERERGKEKYQKNKEQHKVICNKYREEHLPLYKNLYLKNKYNITLDDKNKMKNEQDNKCLICKNEFKDDKSTYVDHCHITNKIRGLLCHTCNSGLGMFKDNIEYLERAIEYLKKHSIVSSNINEIIEN